MHSRVRISLVGAAAVVVIVAGCVPVTPLDGSSGGPGRTSPSPTATTTAIPASPVATSPSPTAPIDTSAWVEYTSERYGLSIRHPADWTVRRSTHVWTLASDAAWDNTASESFIAPDTHIRISAWSAPLEPGTSLEAWIDSYCPLNTAPCTGIQERAVAVYAEGRDRHPGVLVPFEGDVQAFFQSGDRIYVVASWRPAQSFDSRRLIEAFALSMCLGCGASA